jgi:hypothetical protein
MRAADFIREDIGNIENNQLADIVTVLSLLHKRVIDDEIPSELPTAMILRYIRNTGLTNIEYQDLLDANEQDPAMQELLANITPEKIKFKTEIQTTANNPDEVRAAAENPQEKVSKMADRALKRRQQ